MKIEPNTKANNVCAVMGILLLLLITESSGLNSQDVNLVFGSPIKEGDDLKMLCLFPVPKNTTIYSVQWYKGQREIFRYFAREQEKKAITFMDLVIDVRHSDMHTLMLKKVPAYMSGNLSCEVTPEEPTHNIVTKTAQLLVVVPPKEKPHLVTSLGMTNYVLTLNTPMTANCTSSPSKPAANITFYINDIQLLPSDPNIGIRTHQEIVKDDYEITFGELELHLHQQYFRDGKIRMRCEATLFLVHKSQSEDFVGELSKPKPQKQGSFFNVLGTAPFLQPGRLTDFTFLLHSSFRLLSTIKMMF